MKYSDVRMRELETFSDHMDAIEAIKDDYLNYVGGIDAWCSGRDTELLVGAKKKIASIKGRARRFNVGEDDD